MNIRFCSQKTQLVIYLKGRLDSITAVYVEAEIRKNMEDYQKIIIDLSDTEYVSSAGLRVFLAVAKSLMGTGGSLCLCNANSVVDEILKVTGFNTFIEVLERVDLP